MNRRPPISPLFPYPPLSRSPHAAAAEAGRDPRRGAGLSGPRQIAVEHDGLHIAALDWGGDGTPLLLLHPNGLCAGLFEPLALRLRDAFRPVAVDLRGHGGTDTPTTPGGFGFALMAADVLAVLDHLGIDGAVALGQSLGGGVTVLVDELRPGLLRRVLLCGPGAFSPQALAGRPPGGGAGARGTFLSPIAP